MKTAAHAFNTWGLAVLSGIIGLAFTIGDLDFFGLTVFNPFIFVVIFMCALPSLLIAWGFLYLLVSSRHLSPAMKIIGWYFACGICMILNVVLFSGSGFSLDDIYDLFISLAPVFASTFIIITIRLKQLIRLISFYQEEEEPGLNEQS